MKTMRAKMTVKSIDRPKGRNCVNLKYKECKTCKKYS